MKGKPSDLKGAVYRFIKNNRVASLATVGKDNVPQVTILYCLIRKDLSIYFMTRIEGRKFQNLIKNPVVSMAFYNEKDLDTVQLTGRAERVDDFDTETQVLYELLKLRGGQNQWTVPPIELFKRGATNELAIIKVTPIEMTLAEFKPLPNGRYKPIFTKIIRIPL